MLNTRVIPRLLNVSAKQWAFIGVIVGILYFLMLAIMINYPNVVPLIKQFWLIWLFPGIFVWGMGLRKIVNETLQDQ